MACTESCYTMATCYNTVHEKETNCRHISVWTILVQGRNHLHRSTCFKGGRQVKRC